MVENLLEQDAQLELQSKFGFIVTLFSPEKVGRDDRE
jgi:hypothetical protein